MFKKFAFAVLSLAIPFVLPSIAAAQDAEVAPRFELSGGATYVPISRAKPENGATFVNPEGSRKGAYVTVHVPIAEAVGFEVQVYDTRGKFVPDPTKTVRAVSALGGIRVTDWNWRKKVSPYFNGLLGTTCRSYNLTETACRLTLQLGAGSNVYATKHMGVNIAAAYTFPLVRGVSSYQQLTIHAGVSFKP